MARARKATEEVAHVTRQAILRALAASAKSGSIAAFYDRVGMRNPSRSYFVRYGNRLHSLKAAVAYALREQAPDALARDFHALDAAKRHRGLGFDVVHNPSAEEKARERIWISRLSRPGQAKFREAIIDLFGRCALSGCTTLTVLEAAQVDPVKDDGSDEPSNGILLRSDLHKLFDANLIAVNPLDGQLSIGSDCSADYSNICPEGFYSPIGGPQLAAFKNRWASFQKLQTQKAVSEK